MKLIVSRGALKQTLNLVQRVLLGVAVLVLAYCGVTIVEAWLVDRQGIREMQQWRPESYGQRSETMPSSSSRRDENFVGRIEIEQLGLSAFVREGVSRETLRVAVGHVPGTALPGETGNVALAGHRDTFFRPLKRVRRGEMIVLTTPRGEYQYKVVSMRVVSPHEVSVLEPTEGETLTLITCHPFYFVGEAPNRYIVAAQRMPKR